MSTDIAPVFKFSKTLFRKQAREALKARRVRLGTPANLTHDARLREAYSAALARTGKAVVAAAWNRVQVKRVLDHKCGRLMG